MKHIIGYHNPPSGAFRFSEKPVPALRSRLIYGKYKQAVGIIPVFDIRGGFEILPENYFQVRYNGREYYITHGCDTTPRCLFSAGIESGARGGVHLVSKEEVGTTARVICRVQASNMRYQGIAVLVLMKPGQQLVLKKWAPVKYYQFLWDGKKIKFKKYNQAEWDIFTKPPEGGEVI